MAFRLMSVIATVPLMTYGQMNSLWNGFQGSLFSNTISPACDAALNTSLSCPISVQDLVPNIQSMGWTTSKIGELCTPQCKNSLDLLLRNVEAECEDESFAFSSGNTSWVDHVKYFHYKFDLVCMQDSVSLEYCRDIENSWNITEMVAAGTVTWPSNTEKCYLDFEGEQLGPLVDANGTCIKPVDDEDDRTTASEVAPLSGSMAALDYYFDRLVIDDDNFGWTKSLDYDEYPLEIQCSSCFISHFKHGFESTFGDVWDDITEQIWRNIKSNCNISDSLTAAHNFTGWTEYTPPVLQSIDVSTCPLQIEVSERTTCDQLALNLSIPSASLDKLNVYSNCQLLEQETLCGPETCEVGVNVGEAMSVPPFVALYSNFTQAQFLRWNPHITFHLIMPDEVVCVGPPGGAYIPQLMPPGSNPNSSSATSIGSQSSSSSTTTTTVSFTSIITVITTRVTTSTTSLTATNTASELTTKTPASTDSTGGSESPTVATTPSPLQSGVVEGCARFYKAVEGDTCEGICQTHDLSITDFERWNPAVGSLCDNLWTDYWFCVAI